MRQMTRFGGKSSLKGVKLEMDSLKAGVDKRIEDIEKIIYFLGLSDPKQLYDLDDNQVTDPNPQASFLKLKV
jgi:hypothetical protein